MDIVLGILGIIQITFLPGLIVLRLFNIRTNLLDKALIIFGTSLIANYCVIFLLCNRCYAFICKVGSTSSL